MIQDYQRFRVQSQLQLFIITPVFKDIKFLLVSFTFLQKACFKRWKFRVPNLKHAWYQYPNKMAPLALILGKYLFKIVAQFVHCYCLQGKFNSSGKDFHVKLLKCVISVVIRESKQAKILSDMSKFCIFFYNVNSSILSFLFEYGKMSVNFSNQN